MNHAATEDRDRAGHREPEAMTLTSGRKQPRTVTADDMPEVSVWIKSSSPQGRN